MPPPPSTLPKGFQGEWKIGGVTIKRFVEMEMDKGNRFILPGATRDVVKSVPWLAPHFATEVGEMIMSIHMLVIDTPGGARIGVDTCIGNDKKRPSIPGWNMLKGPFLQDLQAHGYPKESFTHILCTHLHIDHVGFNTTWDGSKWIPTFPKAKYAFARTEYEHWAAEAALFKSTGKKRYEETAEIQMDSVQPIVDAGLCELVDMEAAILDEPACKIRLIPTPGHTPGHVSISISSKGDEALITGDCTHHPIQMALMSEVTSATNADTDKTTALATRAKLFARLADETPNCKVFGTHYATPSCGFVRRDGSAFKYVPIFPDVSPPPAKL